MTLAEFEVAAKWGMGRAALCLLENDPAPYLPALAQACLQSSDQTLRADYLLSLATYAKAKSHIESEILCALPGLERNGAIEEAWNLLGRFAARGHPRSKWAIKAYAARSEEGARLVASCGVEGLRWLMEALPFLFEGENDRLVSRLIDDARLHSAQGEVEAMLPPPVRASYEAVSAARLRPHRVDVFGLTPESFIAQLAREDGMAKWWLAREFAGRASEEDCVRLAELSLTEEARESLGWLDGFFEVRPWALDPALALDRLDGPEGTTWISILKHLEDPRLRLVGLERLERGSPDWRAAAFLERNVLEQDEGRLMRVLERVDLTNWRSHDAFEAIAEMAKRAKPGLASIFEWGIEHSDCATCRVAIMKGLARNGLLDARYRREAAFDVGWDVWDYADDRLAPYLAPYRFRRAASRGLGRAIIALMESSPAPYREEIRIVTLDSAPMFRREFASRAGYVVRLTELADNVEEVLDSLILAMSEPRRDDYLHDWRITVLTEFAERGSSRAQAELPQWQEEADESPPEPEDIPAATDVSELLRRFESQPDPSDRGYEARRFGRIASEGELRLWAERMLQESDRQSVEAMGRAFLQAPWPLDVETIMARAEDSRRYGGVWRRMLMQREDPEIRPFALSLLAQDNPACDAIFYLRNAFQRGDEDLILVALRRVRLEEEDCVDDFAREVVAIARAHGSAFFIPHLEWVVEHAPSSRVRGGAVVKLLRANALSDYHRREAVYDAEPRTRALVAK